MARRRFTWRRGAVFLAGVLLVLLADPRPGPFAAGCVLAALAWALRIWSFGHLEKNVVLVTTGPYAHTRNPAYLGTFLALLGCGIAAGNPETTRGLLVWGLVAFLALAFFFLYLPRKFAKEYPRLRELFGQELERHAANVPDLLPRLRPWRSGDPRRFSWHRVGENHEWPWGLVLLLVLLLIRTAPHWSPLAP